jgi:hypothetical protein
MQRNEHNAALKPVLISTEPDGRTFTHARSNVGNRAPAENLLLDGGAPMLESRLLFGTLLAL